MAAASDPTGQASRLAEALAHGVPVLLKAIAGSAVEEIHLEQGDLRLVLRRPLGRTDTPAAASEVALPAVSPPEALLIEHLGVEVRSAYVGIFHRSREQGAPPLSEVGSHVEAGKAIGVIETLGMSGEVECPVSGTLVELRVEDGQAVEYGQVLAIVDPD